MYRNTSLAKDSDWASDLQVNLQASSKSPSDESTCMYVCYIGVGNKNQVDIEVDSVN